MAKIGQKVNTGSGGYVVTSRGTLPIGQKVNTESGGYVVTSKGTFERIGRGSGRGSSAGGYSSAEIARYEREYGKIPLGAGYRPGQQYFTPEEWAAVQAKENAPTPKPTPTPAPEFARPLVNEQGEVVGHSDIRGNVFYETGVNQSRFVGVTGRETATTTEVKTLGGRVLGYLEKALPKTEKTVYVEPGVVIPGTGGARIDVEGRDIESGGVKYVARKGIVSETSMPSTQPKALVIIWRNPATGEERPAALNKQPAPGWQKTSQVVGVDRFKRSTEPVVSVENIPSTVYGRVTTALTKGEYSVVSRLDDESLLPVNLSPLLNRKPTKKEVESAAASYAAKLKSQGFEDVDWYKEGGQYVFTAKQTAPEGSFFPAGEKGYGSFTEEFTAPNLSEWEAKRVRKESAKALYAARGDAFIMPTTTEKGVSFFVPSSPLTKTEKQGLERELAEKNFLLGSGLMRFKPEKQAEVAGRARDISLRLLGGEQAKVSGEAIELELERRALVESPFRRVGGVLTYAPTARSEAVAAYEQSQSSGQFASGVDLLGRVGHNISSGSLAFSREQTWEAGKFGAGFFGGTIGMTASAPSDIMRTGFEVGESRATGNLGARVGLFAKEMVFGFKTDTTFSVGAVAGTLALGKGFGVLSKKYLTSAAVEDIARTEGKLALVESDFLATARQDWYQAIGKGLFDVKGIKARVAGAFGYSTEMTIEPPIVVKPKTIVSGVVDFKSFTGRSKQVAFTGGTEGVVTPVTGKPSGFVEPAGGMPEWGTGQVTSSYASVIPKRAVEPIGLPKSFNVVKWSGIDITERYFFPKYVRETIVKAKKIPKGEKTPEFFGFASPRQYVVERGALGHVTGLTISKVKRQVFPSEFFKRDVLEFHTHPLQPSARKALGEKLGGYFEAKPSMRDVSSFKTRELLKTRAKKHFVFAPDYFSVIEKRVILPSEAKIYPYSYAYKKVYGVTRPTWKPFDFVYKGKAGEEAFGAVAGKAWFSSPESLVGKEFETGARFTRKGTVGLGDWALTEFKGKGHAFESLPKVKRAVESPFAARQLVKIKGIEAELGRVASKRKQGVDVNLLSADVSGGSVQTQLERAALSAKAKLVAGIPRVTGGEVSAFKAVAIEAVEASEAGTFGNILSVGGGALTMARTRPASVVKARTMQLGFALPKGVESNLMGIGVRPTQVQLMRVSPGVKGMPRASEFTTSAFKASSSLRSISLPRSASLPRTKQLPRAVNVLRTQEVPRALSFIAPRAMLGLRGMESSMQRMAQVTRALEVPRPVTPVTPIPVTPVPPTPIIPVKFGFGLPTKKHKKKGKQAYRVLVKRKGKWLVLKEGLPRGFALRAGEQYSLKTLGASFKIEPEGLTELEDIAYVPSKDVFRSFKIVKGKAIPLVDTFIQRRGKRLASWGERAEIKRSKREKKSERLSFPTKWFV